MQHDPLRYDVDEPPSLPLCAALAWPGLELELSGLHVPLLLAFAIAMLISVIENTGNIMLVQQISQRNFRRVSYDRIQSGLYCDGLSKVAAGMLGTAFRGLRARREAHRDIRLFLHLVPHVLALPRGAMRRGNLYCRSSRATAAFPVAGPFQSRRFRL